MKGLISARYQGRLQGLLDGLAIKYGKLSSETFSNLSEIECSKYSSQGIIAENCYEVIDKLKTLALYALKSSSWDDDSPTLDDEIREYKIGLSEGIMVVKHNNDLMMLTSPVDFWRLAGGSIP